MISLEQVERLREKADVSYDEAKAALEAANGDLLEALINLEKQGKVNTPSGGGYYSSDKSADNAALAAVAQQKQNRKCCDDRSGFRELMRKFWRFCGDLLHRGNINSFEVMKGGEVKASVSITILVLLLICFFWVTLPLLVVGLFFGFRYRFRGPDLGKDIVNNAMDTAAEAAESIKKTVAGENTTGSGEN